MQSNGHPPKPAIVVFWDNDKQTLEYACDQEQIETPSMLAAVLSQAADLAKFNLNMNLMQAVQQRQMQVVQEAAIKQKILH